MSAPPDGEVHLWTIALGAARSTEELRAALPAYERARADALGEVTRRETFILTRVATRSILGAYLDLPPRRLLWRTEQSGKPEIDGCAGVLSFNLTHSGEFALLAVTGGCGVGVDLEAPRSGFPAVAFAARYFPSAEAELVRTARSAYPVFARLWTRKEACVKAAGVRLAQGLRLSVAGTGGTVIVRDPRQVVPGVWTVIDLNVPGGYTAAVALAGLRPATVISRAWRPGPESASQFVQLARS
ncbi:4'-phosphopantetheinyl transferase family protein [Nocardia sp. NPDC088792]|uniref:4'-phosphopantetheinyl transferase family protein n=1 Tax=Nocardia sp. NPDC088792 TaxID=3364332 RepID=UPI003807D401